MHRRTSAAQKHTLGTHCLSVPRNLTLTNTVGLLHSPWVCCVTVAGFAHSRSIYHQYNLPVQQDLSQTVKVGFHYPSSRPELTARELGSSTRVVETDLYTLLSTLQVRNGQVAQSD